ATGADQGVGPRDRGGRKPMGASRVRTGKAIWHGRNSSDRKDNIRAKPSDRFRPFTIYVVAYSGKRVDAAKKLEMGADPQCKGMIQSKPGWAGQRTTATEGQPAARLFHSPDCEQGTMARLPSETCVDRWQETRFRHPAPFWHLSPFRSF